MDVAQFWDLVLQFEYDEEELLRGIQPFLAPFRGKKIIDCCCGTGFLTLKLIRNKYNITCADGSEIMLRYFRKQAKKMNVPVAPIQILWQHLGQTFPNQFDLLCCRGSSLVYCDAWEQDAKASRQGIMDSLRSFYQCLKPGGTLYVDTTSSEALAQFTPLLNNYPPKIIDDHHVQFTETIEQDPKKGIRTWKPVLTVDGKKHARIRHSLYVPHQKLHEMLTAVGFNNIQPQNIRGEHYAVFTTQKS